MSPVTVSATQPLRFTTSRAHIGPIIVAVGGNDALSALHAAKLLGLQSGKGIIAVAVLEPMPMYAMGLDLVMVPPEFESERRDVVLTELKAQVKRVIGEHSAWTSRVVYGEPSRAIADVAREEKASLIVMGIGRYKPIDRLLGAETTLRTIRRASCPVLAVGPALDAPLQHVVVATDFSPACARAAQLVLPLLGVDATMHFVHVWQPIELGTARAREIDATYRSALPDRFNRLISVVAPPAGVLVKYEVREGRPAECILDFAEAHDADLIVAGREGLGFLERLMVGSVSASLLRRASCSLFVAREPAFADVDQLQRLLSGRSESRSPEQWATQLNAFSHRNARRRVELQCCYPMLAAETLETGFALVGSMYDPHDQRVELMFGDPDDGAKHFTRGVGHIRAITVMTDANGSDRGLQIDHREGQTLLTLLPV